MKQWLALLLAALLVLTGCTPVSAPLPAREEMPVPAGTTQEDTAPAPNDPDALAQALTAGLASLPERLDPALCVGVDAMTVCAQLFSGLARWDVDDAGAQVVVADLAESLPAGVQNENGTVTYTYTLREGACWSDGMPVTAADFAYGWQRAAEMLTDAPYGYLLEVIDGYTEGDAAARLNVQAADARTLVVTLREATPWWEQLLALPVFSPVRQDVTERDGWDTDRTHFVSDGRYLLTDWSADVMQLQKNPCHPDAANVALPQLTLRTADAGTLLAQFESGAWQFAGDVPSDALERLDGSEALSVAGRCATYFLCWNNNAELLPEESSLTDEAAELARMEVRRALSRLLDRSALVAQTGGGQVAAGSLVALGVTEADGSQFCEHAGSYRGGGYYDVTPEAADTNRALALQVLKKYYAFDEETGKFVNFPESLYLYNTSEGHAQVADFLQTSFAALGIPMEVHDLQSAEFLSARGAGEFTLARGGWAADYDDAAAFLQLWTTDAAANAVQLGRGKNALLKAYSVDVRDLGYDLFVQNGTWAETYDALLALTQTCADRAVRTALLHRAEDLLMQTGCVMPLSYYTDVYLLDAKVQGFYTSPLGEKYFWRCVIEA